MDTPISDRSTRLHLRRPHIPQVGAAVLILLLAVLYLASKDPIPEDAVEPTPRPTPDVVAASDELRTLPVEVPPDVRDRISDEIARLLDDLYERAFLPPVPPPETSASPAASPTIAPTPVPRAPVRDLFTPPAAGALDAAPDPFRTIGDERIRSGTVRFNGFVTVDGDRPLEAHVQVEFRGKGRVRVGDHTRPLDLAQTGQLALVATPEGWRVFGYDVVLTAERLVPAPPSSPGPGAAGAPGRTVSGRWGA